MTENEIIKALEGMTYGGHSCMHCKYGTTKGDVRCGLQGCKVGRDALDLINRQQAEIERLTEERDFYKAPSSLLAKGIEQIKSEAIKEFAERLKSEMYTVGFDIDNLVKEMTEVSDE